MSTPTPGASNRVVFYNLKDGKPFFDCHPAEARVAVDAVKRLCKGEAVRTIEDEEADEAREVIRAMLEAERELIPQGERHSPAMKISHVTAQFVSDIIALVEHRDMVVTHLLMNAETYADMRMWGKHVIDPETRQHMLMAGLFAQLWMADVCVIKVRAAPVVTKEPHYFEHRFTFEYKDPKPEAFVISANRPVPDTPEELAALIRRLWENQGIG